MYDISIVIPTFNAGPYLARAVASALRAMPPQSEVVVVDDGSTDGSSVELGISCAQEIASGQLKIIRAANNGVSAARNLGVQAARGTYIGFLDADDVLTADYYAALKHCLSTVDADIIEFGFRHVRDCDGTALAEYIPFQPPGLTRKALLERRLAEALWYPWSRIYARKLVLENPFPEGVTFCEDLMTIPKIYIAAKAIHTLPKPLYSYYINPNSATRKIRDSHIDRMRQFLAGFQARTLSDAEQLWAASVFFAIYSCSRKAGREVIFDESERRLLQELARGDASSRLSLRRRIVIRMPRVMFWLSEAKIRILGGMR